MTPPLRDKSNQEQLWKGLRGNDLQVISTDHCPFCFKEQKELGRDDFSKIPNGGPGVEHRMSLIYDGGVVAEANQPESFRRVDIDGGCEDLRTCFRRKARSPSARTRTSSSSIRTANKRSAAKTHHMRVDYSAYEGRSVRGVTETVHSAER